MTTLPDINLQMWHMAMQEHDYTTFKVINSEMAQVHTRRSLDGKNYFEGKIGSSVVIWSLFGRLV